MLRLETAAERVCDQLRFLILRGELPPGTQLVQRVLAKRMGVSAMPVVEALRWLERDGLVVRVPKWGAFVKEWTMEEVREAFLLRRAIECEAAPLFIARASAEDRAGLQALNATFNRLSEAGDGRSACVADYDLHAQIVRGARLPLFERALDRSMAAILTISMAQRLLDAQTVAAEVGLHDHMVAVLLRDDPEEARRVVRDHIEDAMAKFEVRMEQVAAAPVSAPAAAATP